MITFPFHSQKSKDGIGYSFGKITSALLCLSNFHKEPLKPEEGNGYFVIPEEGNGYFVIPEEGNGYFVIPEQGNGYFVILEEGNGYFVSTQ